MFSPTTHKGQIGETAVIFEATRKGYFACPAPEGAPYDMVTDRGNLCRVQVKYISQIDGKLTLKLDTFGSGVQMRRYTPKNVDAIVIYDSTDNKTYWIPADRLKVSTNTNASMTLRVKPSKNNQTKGVTWASEFEEW